MICGECLIGFRVDICSNENVLFFLRLVPSVLLTFVHEQPNEMGNYLKDELLMLIQDM